MKPPAPAGGPTHTSLVCNLLIDHLSCAVLSHPNLLRICVLQANLGAQAAKSASNAGDNGSSLAVA